MDNYSQLLDSNITETKCLMEVVTSAEQWEQRFATYLPEDLAGELLNIDAFIVDETGNRLLAESLRCAISGFINLLLGSQEIGIRRLKELDDGFLRHRDLYILVLKELIPRIPNLKENVQFWNVYRFLRFLPLPSKNLHSSFYETKANIMGRHWKVGKAKRHYQEAWLALLKHNLPKTLLKKLVPYLSEHVIDAFSEPFLLGDFLFRTFEIGEVFGILSLAGIFKLIVKYNFEYPNFYQCAYELITPTVCYLSYREKFFTLLDTFLSSTHLPTYIVAAFVKRLSRISLLVPVSCQEPLLALIRNLITRHKNVEFLIHRDNPETLSEDPYNEEELDLQKCGAMESSLWEIKTLQNHWYPDVAKRAKFINKGMQRMESFVRWRTDNDYFQKLFCRRFGSSLLKHEMEENFRKKQDQESSSDDDAQKVSGESRKKRKLWDAKDPRYAIPISDKEPSDFFRDLKLRSDI